jgi:hypothetical protein
MLEGIEDELRCVERRAWKESSTPALMDLQRGEHSCSVNLRLGLERASLSLFGRRLYFGEMQSRWVIQAKGARVYALRKVDRGHAFLCVLLQPVVD